MIGVLLFAIWLSMPLMGSWTPARTLADPEPSGGRIRGHDRRMRCARAGIQFTVTVCGVVYCTSCGRALSENKVSENAAATGGSS